MHITEKGNNVGRIAFITKFKPVKVASIHVFILKMKITIKILIKIDIMWFFSNESNLISNMKRIAVKMLNKIIVNINIPPKYLRSLDVAKLTSKLYTIFICN